MNFHAPLEMHPSSEQRERLANWVTEILIICRRYDVVIDTSRSEVAIVDIRSGTTLGVELQFLVNEHGRVTSCEVVDSILDGVWLVETVEGQEVEARTLGSIHPEHEGPVIN